jgi:hypothetical protein
MHEVQGVGLAMTWEVFGDMQARYEDCFRMFNPLTQRDYDRVVRSWTAAILGMVAGLPGHPGVPLLQGVAAERAMEAPPDVPDADLEPLRGGSDPEPLAGEDVEEQQREEEKEAAAEDVEEDAAVDNRQRSPVEAGLAASYVRAAASASRSVAGSWWALGVAGLVLLLWAHPRSRFWLSSRMPRARRRLDIPL